MRIFRAPLALAALLLSAGCGYVHFGRLPDAGAPAGDAALAAAYSDVRTQNKILQQELALARKEGDALRSALDSGGNTRDLAARLEATSRELATLRANYTKLTEGKPAAADPEKVSALEDKLAATLRDYTQLQDENARLRADVTHAREENTALAAQLKTAAAQNEQAQSALAQLNTELLAQKEARVRSEQQTAAARAQLAVVLAKSTDARASLAEARETSATGADAIAAPLRVANAPASDAPPTAELRTKDRANKSADSAPPAKRIHIVAPGDSLETLAKKYYGDPARWTLIYSANNAQLSGGRPLTAGMELEIPEK